MSQERDQVEDFHYRFEHPIAGAPTIPADDRVRLRLALIAEEFIETYAALTGGTPEEIATAIKNMRDSVVLETIKVDLPAFADALADLRYVILGAELEFGINGDAVFDLVHAANMAKLGPDGKPIKREDGKTLKPEGWQPPDIAAELRRQGWKP